jgi:hypothetical protein
MKTIFGFIAGIIIIGLGFYFVPKIIKNGVSENEGPVACTMEAMLCPDGSAVGRTGPNCEFAACPGIPDPRSVAIKMNESVTSLGVTIKPVELIEDSRCPADAICIQQGRVRMRAEITSGLGTSTDVFEINSFVTTEAEKVTLLEVNPYPLASDPAEIYEYEFVFRVEKL